MNAATEFDQWERGRQSGPERRLNLLAANQTDKFALKVREALIPSLN